jgi:hypothetical protein
LCYSIRTCMDSLVFAQSSPVCKRFPAEATLIRALSGVDADEEREI